MALQSLPFSQAHELNARLKGPIADFWQQGHFNFFTGVKNINIHYCYFINEQFNQTIILIPGRSESYLKYQETCYDFYRQGYNVCSMDHRGQGLSDRLLSDTNKGYVDSFEDYSQDLGTFINLIHRTVPQNKLYLLAHSMGAAISLRYLSQQNTLVSAAVLSSPMIGINSGKTPQRFAMWFVTFAYKVNRLLSASPWYFIGQGRERRKNFTQNKLSHCVIRYNIFTDLFQRNKRIQLRGVTLKWLIEAQHNRLRLFKNIKKISSPILILQANNDSIVDNKVQNEYCQKLHAYSPQYCPLKAPLNFKDAYHELLFERDEIRQRALAETLNFFNKY